jgi:hypothetical protein
MALDTIVVFIILSRQISSKQWLSTKPPADVTACDVAWI